MGFAMFDIDNVKVGDVWVCGRKPHRQLFYIHNVIAIQGKITSSGLSENSMPFIHLFPKSNVWAFDRKGDKDEVMLFYKLIEEYGYKFNRNTGIKRYVDRI